MICVQIVWDFSHPALSVWTSHDYSHIPPTQTTGRAKQSKVWNILFLTSHFSGCQIASCNIQLTALAILWEKQTLRDDTNLKSVLSQHRKLLQANESLMPQSHVVWMLGLFIFSLYRKKKAISGAWLCQIRLCFWWWVQLQFTLMDV